jgi:hypothetical protein
MSARRRPPKPTPKKPPVRGRIERAAMPTPPPRRRDPATVSGHRSGIDCPVCRVELLTQELVSLACPGCGRGFWMRGAELVPEGAQQAVVVPDRILPRAQATMRVKKP